MAIPTPTWTVIYDGDCGLCATLLALILRADRSRRLTPLALDTPRSDRLLSDLTPAQRNASWHLIDPAGRRTSAGAAAAPVLRLLPGGALPAALLARMPTQTERAYRLVAEHRAAIGRFVPSRATRRAQALVARRTAAPAAAEDPHVGGSASADLGAASATPSG